MKKEILVIAVLFPLIATNKVTVSREILGCKRNGKIYPYGESIPTGNPCNKCICDRTSKRVLCTIEDCGFLLCAKPFTPKGQCCPICTCANHKGEHYNPGESFKSIVKINGHSNCMECKCSYTEKKGPIAKCIKPLCSGVQCQHPVVEKEKCCPSCGNLAYNPNCKFNNQNRYNGEKWKLYKCIECRCLDGQVSCRKHCPRLNCVSRILKKGSCCPTCRGKFPELGDYIILTTWTEEEDKNYIHPNRRYHHQGRK